MGFFKNLITKFPCELCGKEVGALSRTKLKDDKYICYDCSKNCSLYYPSSIKTLDEVKEHIEYMQNMDKFCKEVFDKDTDRKDFSKLFPSVGIIFSDKLGMFEVVSKKAKERNYRELFRYSQIWDYKLYGIENTGENVTKKYKETGVKIKLISKRDNDPLLNAFHTYDSYKHPYAEELTIPCVYATDNLEGGFVLQHLDEIFKVGKYDVGKKDNSKYRNLEEVDRYFKRENWKDVADTAETEYFGKAL